MESERLRAFIWDPTGIWSRHPAPPVLIPPSAKARPQLQKRPGATAAPAPPGTASLTAEARVRQTQRCQPRPKDAIGQTHLGHRLPQARPGTFASSCVIQPLRGTERPRFELLVSNKEYEWIYSRSPLPLRPPHLLKRIRFTSTQDVLLRRAIEGQEFLSALYRHGSTVNQRGLRTFQSFWFSFVCVVSTGSGGF
jgi:hypothetical protein